MSHEECTRVVCHMGWLVYDPSFRKKKRVSWRNRVHLREELWEVNFSSYYKTSSFGELKSCTGWRFWNVYMNSLNLFYVVIIFLILKIYES